MKKLMALFLAGVMMATMAVGVSAAPKKKVVRIEVVSKGYQHEFWRTVEKGALDAGAKFGANINFIGPESETEISKQVGMVENAINKRVDAIALAPVDGTALLGVAKRAIAEGIPMVTFDSRLAEDVSLSFIATDNVAAGGIAAEGMAKAINFEGKVAIVSHLAGTSSAIDREKGFRDVMAKYPKIKILNTQFSGGDKSKALSITSDIILANPDLKGVYGTAEGNSVGVARAVEEKGLQNKIVVVGFDSSEDEINLLQKGVIKGMVVQNPYNMGYLAVQNVIAAVNKKPIEKRIDTGAVFVTMENFKTAKVQKVLYPFGK